MTTPNDAFTPSEAEILEEAIASSMIDVHTSLPGRVAKFDALKQTADIELGVRRVLPKDDGTYITESFPILSNVPVAFYRTAGLALTLPVDVGDTGLVIFTEAAIDQWRGLAGGPASPGDIGRHTITGAVFMPGLVPTLGTIPGSTPVTAPAGLGTNLILGTVANLKNPFNGEMHLVIKPGADPTMHLGSEDADEPLILGDVHIGDFANHTHSALGAPPTLIPGGGSPLLPWSLALSERVFTEK